MHANFVYLCKQPAQQKGGETGLDGVLKPLRGQDHLDWSGSRKNVQGIAGLYHTS